MLFFFQKAIVLAETYEGFLGKNSDVFKVFKEFVNITISDYIFLYFEEQLKQTIMRLLLGIF